MIQPSPTNDRTAEAHKSLVDVDALVESCAQSADLMQQRDRLFHDVSEYAQPAAVFGIPSRQLRSDTPLRQLGSMWVAAPTRDLHPEKTKDR